jgi:hypothetical protein
MASRDRTVTYLRLPPELLYLVACYQNDRRFAALNQAVQELLETHPRIAQIAERVYDEGKAKSRTDGG